MLLLKFLKSIAAVMSGSKSGSSPTTREETPRLAGSKIPRSAVGRCGNQGSTSSPDTPIPPDLYPEAQSKEAVDMLLTIFKCVLNLPNSPTL